MTWQAYENQETIVVTSSHYVGLKFISALTHCGVSQTEKLLLFLLKKKFTKFMCNPGMLMLAFNPRTKEAEAGPAWSTKRILG